MMQPSFALQVSDPISRHRVCVPYAMGASLADIAPVWHTPYIAIVGDAPVLRADWATTYPAPGQPVLFIALPQDPVTAIVAAFAADAVATYVATEIVWAAAATMAISTATFSAIYGLTYAAVYMGATAVMSAAIGTPSAPSAQALSDATAASPTYSLTSQSNQARVNQPIPVQYGRMKVFPDLMTMPYGEYRTDIDADGAQYLIQTLMIGQGSYDIEGVYIDDTPLDRFLEVSYGILQPGQTAPDTVPQRVHAVAEVSGNTLETGAALAYNAVPEGRTAAQIDIDLTYPRGLYYSENDGSLSTVSAVVTLEYREAGSSNVWMSLVNTIGYGPWSGWNATWSTADRVVVSSYYDPESGWMHAYGPPTPPANTLTEEYQIGNCSNFDYESGVCYTYYIQRRTRSAHGYAYVLSAATMTPQRRTLKFTVPAGRWEVRATRIDTKSTSHRTGHEVIWSGCRVHLDAPTGYDPAHGNTTRLWMVMRATEQLSGLSARKLSVIGTRKLPVWNGSTWSAPQVTRSPAWAIADVLRAAYGAALPDAQIDMAGLIALDAEWAARGDYFDAVFDTRLTVWEALGKIARVGRARAYMQGGRIRIARDRLEATPIALFSPANMLAGSFSVQYAMPGEQTAEEIRVRYFSALTWKQAETIYTLASADPDRFAEVDLFGVTSSAQAQREARYLAQTNRYRRRIVSFDVELEGMILSPLDPILISHDLPDWGQHAIVMGWNNGVLTVDRPMTWTTGATHWLRLRNRDGSASNSLTVTRGNTDADIVLGAYSGNIDLSGREPTHVVFGAGTAWQVMAKVLTIRPRDEYSATVTALIENNLVHEGC